MVLFMEQLGEQKLIQNFSGVDSSFSVNVEPLIDGEVTLSINNDSAFDLAGNGILLLILH